MKILHLTHNYFPSIGGAQLVVHHLANAQRALGDDAQVMVPRKRKKRFAACVDYPLHEFGVGFSTCTRQPSSWRTSLWGSLFGSYTAMREHFDIWHFHGEYPEGVLLPFAKKHAIPSVVTIHSSAFGCSINPIQYEKDVFVAKHILSYADAVCLLCNEDVEKFISLGIAEEKIKVMNNGVAVNAFSNISDTVTTRKQYGLPLDAPVLISSGRYDSVKGFDLIPSILVELNQRGIKAYWCVVGRHTEQLKEIAVAQGVAEQIIPLGELSPIQETGITHPPAEYVALLQCADMYVSTSRNETFSLVSYEALAAGLPLVYTDIARSQEFDSWGVGRKVAVGDIQGTAQAIAELVDSPAIMQRCAENGKRHVFEAYSWELIAQQYRTLYQSLL